MQPEKKEEYVDRPHLCTQDPPHTDGAEGLGHHPGDPGRQRQALAPRRLGAEPKAQQKKDTRISGSICFS